jgi:hypothetical protein
VRAQTPENLKTVKARQHDVEHNQIEAAPHCRLETGSTVV